VGDTIATQQVVITGPDGYAEFQVADGSHFEVFQNSRVIFRNNPGDWRDLLDVLIGKVKVQIEKLGGLPNPNKVRTPTAVISVRGTVFDVNVEDDDATTLVLVEEGQVEVRHLLRGGEGRLLNQGEWIRVFKNQAIADKVVDRGAVMQRALRATMDAVYQVVLNGGGASRNGSTAAAEALLEAWATAAQPAIRPARHHHHHRLPRPTNPCSGLIRSAGGCFWLLPRLLSPKPQSIP